MFGAPQASTGFSFGSAPAFGAAGSAPAFGSSTPAFGGPPAFGATSTPAFGAASSAPAFGASSAPAFGAPASGGGFSFASTPASGFGSTSTFGASSASGFGASSTPPFGQSAPQPTLFGGFGQQPAQQAQQQQQQVPFTRATTFESLPPDFQKYLQQIQDQMSKFEADRLKVQQLPHLQETPGQQQGMDSEIAAVRADLKELSKDIKIQMESVQDVKEKAQKLLKACDTICNVYNRNRGWRMEMQLKGVQDLSQYLQEPINLPGPFLQDSVLGFCQAVAELSKVLDEVEQVLQTSGLQDPSQVDWRYVLPTIVSNMHDYFIAVAAKLERAHTEVERLKPAYLAHRRAQGIYTDPFERARRQEQLQHQQQRPAPSAAAQQHGALPAAAAGALPALPAPPSGGMFGAQTPATPAPQATPGMGAGSFGSPFLQAGTPLGASPFGGNANAGLSRSASKPKSKKR